MNNQKTIFAIIAIVVALSFAAIAPAMMNTAMAAHSRTGNPHHGQQTGDPHIDHKTGNPHRCPGNSCHD